jgi:hypothetical protein
MRFIYDVVKGLVDLKVADFSTSREYTSLDECIASVLAEDTLGPEYAELIRRLSFKMPLTYGVPSGLKVVDPAVMMDDATLRLFSCNSTFDDLPPPVEPRALEICVRLTEWMYGRNLARVYTLFNEGHEATTLKQSLPIEWVAYMLENRDLDSGVAEGEPACDQSIESTDRYIGRSLSPNWAHPTPILQTDQKV